MTETTLRVVLSDLEENWPLERTSSCYIPWDLYLLDGKITQSEFDTLCRHDETHATDFLVAVKFYSFHLISEFDGGITPKTKRDGNSIVRDFDDYLLCVVRFVSKINVHLTGQTNLNCSSWTRDCLICY